MSHDASKVQLGQVPHSAKRIRTYNSDPATFKAGLVVRQSSAVGVLSLLKSAGAVAGVSIGRSLSDIKKTSVCKKGERVPVSAHLKRATGTVTVTSFANLLTTTPDTLAAGGVTFTAQAGAATTGTATFRAATSNILTATSLAVQINAHAVASLVVFALDNGDGTVTIYSIADGVGSTGTGNDSALTYTDNGGGNIGITLSGLVGGKLSGGDDAVANIAYMVIGQKMYVNNLTGKADIAVAGMSTISDGTYEEIKLTGIDEDGVSAGAACKVSMVGGL